MLDKKAIEKINKVLKFAKSLIGTPRGKGSWDKYKIGSDEAPFWSCDKNLKKKSEIKKKGTNCVGLINLMRRYAGLSVNVIGKVVGTGDIFDYLKKKKRLQIFDFTKNYPAGTMLLRDYNPIDQGHVAVIFKENKKGVLFSSLIHSVGWNDGSNKKIVKIDASVGKSHFAQYNGTTNEGHYTHICLPENWILKE